MKVIEFKGSNSTYAKGQSEYLNLPAFKKIDGTVISCWKSSFTERLRILFTGKIWLSVLTFNKRLHPSFMSTRKPSFKEN